MSNVIWEIVGTFPSDLEKRNNTSMLERGRYGMPNSQKWANRSFTVDKQSLMVVNYSFRTEKLWLTTMIYTLHPYTTVNAIICFRNVKL